jgi:hypothetical protein
MIHARKMIFSAPTVNAIPASDKIGQFQKHCGRGAAFTPLQRGLAKAR